MRIMITGANRGIGLAIVGEFLKQGHEVIAGVRDIGRADKLAELREAHPGLLTLLTLDVQEEESVREAASQVSEAQGNIDVIINNAAIAIGRPDTVGNADLADYETTFQTNVFGPVRVCKHFIPLIQEGERAMVINMSSTSGIMDNCKSPDYSYGMSKAALNMFTGKLRHELAGRSIKVYSVHPGWVRTDQGGPDAPLDACEPAKQIYELVAGLQKPDHDGFFIHADGSHLPF
ncbi:SDR family oxidoreductase [Cohnella sp. WQ 127256]|uniref:SDR family oxidoreductase n=1 Tax=Cohnella sp. WQ 127256 TaxID=2938790 RepID=UPI00211736A7|nr:SDR family oxidoreductase [Cohnella sp. WQ 127256]